MKGGGERKRPEYPGNRWRSLERSFTRRGEPRVRPGARPCRGGDHKDLPCGRASAPVRPSPGALQPTGKIGHEGGEAVTSNSGRFRVNKEKKKLSRYLPREEVVEPLRFLGCFPVSAREEKPEWFLSLHDSPLQFLRSNFSRANNSNLA